MSNPQGTFDDLVGQWRSGQLTVEGGRIENVAPLDQDDIHFLPSLDSAEYAQLSALGRRAIDAGEVGAIILSGGMATRFDYDRPRGLYPILSGKSFLRIKIEWLLEVAPDIPIFIMTSFATDAEVRWHLEDNRFFGASPGQIQCFIQGKFPRLTLHGDLFTPSDPADAYAAPGHGDFPEALAQSGLLDRFLNGGGRYLVFSNVDNLGASLDATILGWHIQSGCEMTVEVAAKAQADKGGAPARVNGRVQLVEGFAFPADFDQDSIAVFNTASYVFTAAALLKQHDLPWYVVEKSVAGQPVIQFEHLAGDLSRTLSVSLLAVEREERFIPVKSQADVAGAQRLIQQKRHKMQRRQEVDSSQ